MSGTTISQLPAALGVISSDLLPVVEIGTPNVTKRLTVAQLLANTMTTTGGVFTGQVEFQQGLLLDNNQFIDWKDTSGTPQPVLTLDTSNNVVVKLPQAQLSIENNAGTVVASIDNAGNLHAPNFYSTGLVQSGTVVASGMTTSALQVNGSGTITANLTVNGGLYPRGNIASIGGLSGFSLYNSSGNPYLAFAANNYIGYNGTNISYYTTGAHYFTGTVNGAGFYGSYLHSSGNVDAAGNVDATGNLNGNLVQSNSNVVANGTVWAGGNGGISLAVDGSNNRILQFSPAPGTTLTMLASNGELAFSRPDGSWICSLMPDGTFTIIGQGWKPGGGVWSDSSDERIKTVTGTYRRGLADILQLIPKRFTYRGNEQLGEGQASPHADVAAQGQEFVGLVAQDVEHAWPSLVSRRRGTIDGEPVDDLRTLDASELLYAAINAIQELAARVATLEARPRGY